MWLGLTAGTCCAATAHTATLCSADRSLETTHSTDTRDLCLYSCQITTLYLPSLDTTALILHDTYNIGMIQLRT